MTTTKSLAMSVSKPLPISERITTSQLLILNHIYKFRFVSTRQLQVVLGKKQIQQVQQRLNLLITKGYIGRNFSKTNRLTGQYASYYLLPKGMKLMKQRVDADGHIVGKPKLEPRVLHNAYKDREASTRFINHSIGVGDIFCELVSQYGKDLHFVPKSLLVVYDYLPAVKPDAYLSLLGKTKDDLRTYFLEYCEETVPFWVYRKRIKEYIDYTDDETWEEAVNTPMPTVLLIAETPVLQRRLQRFLKRALPDSYSNVRFLVTNREALTTAEREDAIWLELDEDEEWVEQRLL